jgi:pyruvate kinase
MADRKFVRAKIVCTIGPASDQSEILDAMAKAGMDVARVNLSHGDRETQRRVLEALNNVEGVSTLIDLPGPKIRIGEVDGSLNLRSGESIHFTTNLAVLDHSELSVSYT